MVKKNSIDQNQIMGIIPHRYPFLLVDRIDDITPEGTGVGFKNVTSDEFWCQGHFPNHPVMPGVLQIEALAQTACAIAFYSKGTSSEENMGYFAAIEKVRFRKTVVPGDVLELHVRQISQKAALYKFEGKAKVNGEVVSEAVFTAMMQ